MRLTRREALTGAGATVLGLRAAGGARAMPPPLLPLRLLRGIDLTPAGVMRPWEPQNYLIVRAQPWAPALLARVAVLRVWADWPTLQPTPVALGDPANPGRANLEALDAQVDAARADGLQVILMPYRYPRWANHAARPHRGVAPEYVLPDAGHGPYSPWAAYVEALWDRYAGRMTHFEVVNEPNLQLHPQPGVAERVAVMMATVDAVARRHDLAAACLAPSSSDAEQARGAGITPQPPFTAALLDALDAAGFAGGQHWIWSFHDYGETERGDDRARRLRAQLAGRWRGRTAPDSGPLLWATEGGVRLSHVERVTGRPSRAVQAELVAAALRRAERTPGLGLHTQYTIHADPNFDCGLRESDGTERPAFRAFTRA